MKKHRFILLILNLVAAAVITLSAFMQWFNSALPMETEANSVAHFIPISINYSRATIETNFSISMLIFISAIFFVLAGILSKKIFSIFATILSGGILVLWFISAGFKLEIFSNISNPSIFGPGVFAAFIATIIGLIAIFIPKKNRIHNNE